MPHREATLSLYLYTDTYLKVGDACFRKTVPVCSPDCRRLNQHQSKLQNFRCGNRRFGTFRRIFCPTTYLPLCIMILQEDLAIEQVVVDEKKRLTQTLIESIGKEKNIVDEAVESSRADEEAASVLSVRHWYDLFS